MSSILEDNKDQSGARMVCAVCEQPIIGPDVRSVLVRLKNEPELPLAHTACLLTEPAAS